MDKGIIIQGSSRSFGDTNKVVNQLIAKTGFDYVDLNKLNIGHFSYEFKNTNDDFIPLFKNIVTNYTSIILVTPIYWYTMSGLMKVFFDRISDFLVNEKEFGRKLRGMNMLSLSTSNESKFYDGFEMPFKNSATYLGMTYKGHLHTWVENSVVPKIVEINIEAFINKALKIA